MHILAEMTPLDPVSGERVTVRASSAQLRAITGLGGQRWWPSILQKPALTMKLFDGDFSSPIEPGTASIILALDQLAKAQPNVRRFVWQGAKVAFYAGDEDTAWPWPTVFMGKVSSFSAQANRLEVQAEVDLSPFEVDVLAQAYAGTTGIEGGADLRSVLKPWVLGRARFVEPVLINAVDSVFQVSAYAPIKAVVALYERGAQFAASVGNYASYAALVAANIPHGRWATCLASGLIRLGAPPAGVITADVEGDFASGVLARRPGAIIRRVAAVAGLSPALLDTASFDAMDAAAAALPAGGNINVVLRDQESVIDFARRIARSCNYQAGVDFQGRLFVTKPNLASPSLTLDAQGRRLPRMLRASEVTVSPPYRKIEMSGERCWRPLSLDEIAFMARLTPRGLYDPVATYREGDFVTLDDGSQWLFTSPTPLSGSAPGPDNPNWGMMSPGIAIPSAAGIPTLIADNVDGGSLVIDRDTVTKAGTNGTDATFYSQESYGSFYLRAIIPGNYGAKIGVASAVPAVNGEHRFEPSSTADLDRIVHNGVYVWSGNWPSGSQLEMVGDGRTIRYYVNGELAYTGSGNAAGPWHVTGQIYSVGNTLEGIRFGPAGPAGSDGQSVGELTIYRSSASAPATPVGGSYNIATRVLTPPAGWSLTMPTSGTRWSASGYVAFTGASGTVTPIWMGVGGAIIDGTPGSNGAAGQGTDVVFRRMATQPPTPPDSSGVPPGWYGTTDAVPPGNDPLWASFRTRASPTAAWLHQTPSKIEGQDGAPAGIPALIAENVGGGSMIVENDRVTKAGTAGWNASVYSQERYGSFYLRYQINNNGGHQVGVTNSPPVAIPEHRFQNSSSVGEDRVYHNGAHVWTGNFAVGAIMEMVGDGKSIRYFHNGTLLYTGSVNVAGPWQLAIGILSATSYVEGIRFSPAGPAGLDGLTGQSTNVIYRKATSQPATPSASAGVPSGWVDSTSALPAGSNPIWVSFGVRAAGATNYVWQTPVAAAAADLRLWQGLDTDGKVRNDKVETPSIVDHAVNEVITTELLSPVNIPTSSSATILTLTKSKQFAASSVRLSGIVHLSSNGSIDGHIFVEALVGGTTAYSTSIPVLVGSSGSGAKVPIPIAVILSNPTAYTSYRIRYLNANSTYAAVAGVGSMLDYNEIKR